MNHVFLLLLIVSIAASQPSVSLTKWRKFISATGYGSQHILFAGGRERNPAGTGDRTSSLVEIVNVNTGTIANTTLTGARLFPVAAVAGDFVGFAGFPLLFLCLPVSLADFALCSCLELCFVLACGYDLLLNVLSSSST